MRLNLLGQLLSHLSPRDSITSFTRHVIFAASSPTNVSTMPPRLRLPHFSAAPVRTFTSHQHPPAPAYTPLESTLLSTALQHVPAHGFTTTSLHLALRAHNYPTLTSSAFFPRGAFSLILFHLHQQRSTLKDRIVFPSSSASTSSSDKLRSLIKTRLQGNVETGVAERWGDALAVMSLAENIPESLRELARLADELVYLSGDTAVDTTWYAQRAGVAGVYAATELFMTTDKSSDYEATWEFLDRRVDDMEKLGSVTEGVGSYLAFTAAAAGNVLRSKNVKFF
ncbi:COQ9-domain-containing protein [Sphaerosporella brunnea]|uniref:Ubiquinone biosynthesis protein n=1 Tax=Sphaerosporella brunnea TaxID=1250544 RepID=A0A5J5EXJ2_9PEZI|nr:COQ9-domain-containing protein [Sphaerosporella brunnea]